MDLANKNNIKKILKKYNIKPSKKLGQNFLIDKNAVKKTIKTADIRPNDIILEIGPGIGTITKETAKKAKKVVAVEKDKNMCEILKKTLKDFKNIEIVQKDVLSYRLQVTGYKIVGNIPFYLTSPVIRKFIELKNPPREMVLIIQKEVAQRICAKPPKMNFLAVCVQFFSEPKIISYISKKSFLPRPKVDSAIIKIVPRRFHVPVSRWFRERFFRIVGAGFSQPRKYLVSNLSKKLKINKEQTEKWLLKNKIKPAQRAETLTIRDWINLTKTL